MRPVIFTGTLEEVLNLVGIFEFASCGALFVVRTQYDVVGMIVLAEMTAIGGGVLRDLVAEGGCRAGTALSGAERLRDGPRLGEQRLTGLPEDVCGKAIAESGDPE